MKFSNNISLKSLKGSRWVIILGLLILSCISAVYGSSRLDYIENYSEKGQMSDNTKLDKDGNVTDNDGNIITTTKLLQQKAAPIPPPVLPSFIV